MNNLNKFQMANDMLDAINGGAKEMLVKMTFSGIDAVAEAEAMSKLANCACGCFCGGGGAGSGGGAAADVSQA